MRHLIPIALLLAATQAEARAQARKQELRFGDPMLVGAVSGVGYTIAYGALAAATGLPNSGRQWNTHDTVMEAIALGLLAMDWRTTLDIKNHGHEEANPILGKRPTDLDIGAYFASTIVLHAAVAAILPKPYRGWWQSTFIGVEVSVLGNNYQTGLRFGF